MSEQNAVELAKSREIMWLLILPFLQLAAFHLAYLDGLDGLFLHSCWSALTPGIFRHFHEILFCLRNTSFVCSPKLNFGSFFFHVVFSCVYLEFVAVNVSASSKNQENLGIWVQVPRGSKKNFSHNQTQILFQSNQTTFLSLLHSEPVLFEPSSSLRDEFKLNSS